MSYAPKIERFFNIAVAMMNCFPPPLFQENSLHLELANRALVRKDLTNALLQKFKRHQWEKSMNGWNNVGEFEDFPVLSDMDLKYITLGVYQVELANMYHKLNIIFL